MSIPESMVEAVKKRGFDDSPEARARRVVLALAENMPESAVEKAREAFNAEDYVPLKLRAAIVAALKDVVEGK